MKVEHLLSRRSLLAGGLEALLFFSIPKILDHINPPEDNITLLPEILDRFDRVVDLYTWESYTKEASCVLAAMSKYAIASPLLHIGMEITVQGTTVCFEQEGKERILRTGGKEKRIDNSTIIPFAQELLTANVDAIKRVRVDELDIHHMMIPLPIRRCVKQLNTKVWPFEPEYKHSPINRLEESYLFYYTENLNRADGAIVTTHSLTWDPSVKNFAFNLNINRFFT